MHSKPTSAAKYVYIANQPFPQVEWYILNLPFLGVTRCGEWGVIVQNLNNKPKRPADAAKPLGWKKIFGNLPKEKM